jgi:NAD(P)-dependent dehydrogenase (short-subunit alcohol dehydrogenase family)
MLWKRRSSCMEPCISWSTLVSFLIINILFCLGELTLMSIVGVGGAMGDATTINLEAWERDFRINVTSMVLMSRFAIPEMRKQGRGSIINMSSVSGRKCFFFLSFPNLRPSSMPSQVYMMAFIMIHFLTFCSLDQQYWVVTPAYCTLPQRAPSYK